MRTKQSFLPFNFFWCIYSFVAPIMMLPYLFPQMNEYILVITSFAFYLYRVGSVSHKDWLEWRISELENQHKTTL